VVFPHQRGQRVEGVGSAPPLEFLHPHPSEIMGGAGADSAVGKKRSRSRRLCLRGMNRH
jgi:hypothetical protein